MIEAYKRYLNVITNDSVNIISEKLVSYPYLDETYIDFRSFIKATTPPKENKDWQDRSDQLEAAIRNAVAFNHKNKNSI